VPVVIKILYTSLVRSKLKYDTVVCMVAILKLSNSMLRYNIQNRFLRFMAFKCNLHRKQHFPYYQPLLDFFLTLQAYPYEGKYMICNFYLS